VLGDLWVAQFAANCFQSREGAFLVLTHQARIADDIDR
jgi:hypothetical protein